MYFYPPKSVVRVAEESCFFFSSPAKGYTVAGKERQTLYGLTATSTIMVKLMMYPASEANEEEYIVSI